MAVKRAYVLVECKPGASNQVQRLVSQMGNGNSGVQLLEADSVTGPFDVIILLKGSDLDAIGRFVHSQIQRVAGVERTLTCPVV